MRQCISLIGSFTTPYDGFCVIFFHAIAVVEITTPKIILRQCISLLGGF